MSLQATVPLLALPLVTLLGLIFGSFVTALSYRLPRGQSVANGRSACPACGATLTPSDLVPVLSWIVHRGKCRHCGAGVSWRYPAIEILTALLFTIAAFAAADVVRLAVVLAMTTVMTALAIIDFEHLRLPNSLLLIFGLLSLVFRYLGDADFTGAALVSAVVFAAAIAVDQAGRRLIGHGLGMGDAKLMAAAALALPIGPFLGALAAAGAAGALMGTLWKRRPEGRNQFPFGPVLLACFWVANLVAY